MSDREQPYPEHSDVEHLDVGRPRGGRGPVATIAALAVVVVIGLVLLHLPDAPTRLVTGPSSSPAPTSSAGPWPRTTGLSGTLYLLTDSALLTLDVGTGLVTSSDVAVEPGETTLTPYAGGVLAWDGTRDATRLVFDAQVDGEVPSALSRQNAYLPGPDGRVWGARVSPTRPTARASWRLYDEAGRVRARAEVVGSPLPDGAGGLFAVNGPSLRQAYPLPSHPWPHGEVLATGPDGWIAQRCAGGRCGADLHDRASGRDTRLGLVPTASSDPGVLSPGNRFVAYLSPGADPQVRVAPLGLPGELRSFASGSRGPALCWLSDRWLVAASGDGLVLHDAVDGVTLLPSLPLQGVTQLLWQAA